MLVAITLVMPPDCLDSVLTTTGVSMAIMFHELVNCDEITVVPGLDNCSFVSGDLVV